MPLGDAVSPEQRSRYIPTEEARRIMFDFVCEITVGGERVFGTMARKRHMHARVAPVRRGVSPRTDGMDDDAPGNYVARTEPTAKP